MTEEIPEDSPASAESRTEADSMPEAEVSLRLAIYLLANDLVAGNVRVSLDGAHEVVGDRTVCDVDKIMTDEGWTKHSEPERTFKSSAYHDRAIEVITRPGVGDVTAVLRNGRRLLVEAKGGALSRSRSSAEYKQMREAIGQLVTCEDVDNVVLVVAVPDGEGFRSRVQKWKDRPLIKQLGIRLVTVSRSGEVRGLT